MHSSDKARVATCNTNSDIPECVDGRDDLWIHLSAQNHLDDLHSLIISDTQTTVEFALQTEPIEQRVDLRPAAVHDNWLDANRVHENDVLGKQTESIVFRRSSKGIPAVLHDDGTTREPTYVGQCFDEDASSID